MATASDLLGLTEAKAHLSLTTDDDNARVEAAITATSLMLESACNTVFVQRSIVEKHWPRGRYLFLRHRPVVSVASVVDPAGNAVSSLDYYVDTDAGTLRHVGFWPVAYNAANLTAQWSVTLTAGWFASKDAVTEEVRRAALVRLAALWERASADVSSVSVGGLSVSYAGSSDDGNAELSEIERMLLSAYISVEV